MDDVVVTANRSERNKGNIAVPVTLISQKQIQQTGSLRLQNILEEQMIIKNFMIRLEDYLFIITL